MALFLELAPFLLAGGSLAVSLLAFRLAARRAASPSRVAERLAQQDVEIADLRDLMSRQATTLKKIAGRTAVQRSRDKGNAEPESPEEWKKRMRLKLHSGGRIE